MMKKTIRYAVCVVIAAMMLTAGGAWAASSVSLPGDIDGDGYAATVRDAILLARYLGGIEVSADIAAMDIDKDGEVTPMDAMILARYIAGWEGYDRYFTVEDNNESETETITLASYRSAVSGHSSVTTLLGGYKGGGKFEITEEQYNALSYFNGTYNNDTNTSYAGLNTTMVLYTVDEAAGTVTIGTILSLKTTMEQGIGVRYYLDLGATVLHDAPGGPHDYLVWTNPNNVNESYVMHLDRH